MNHSISDTAALASRFINHTNRNIFLTGKAGTGKTTFLRHIVRCTHKKAVIAAPTGIAAINAGGVTLHSLFQLPFGCFVPVNQASSATTLRFSDPYSLIRNQYMSENKRRLLREMELLIIDEVSMLRADLLDAIDTVLRHVRKKNHLPFGGVQVLFIGDLLQLPPVVKDEEWNLLKTHYNSAFFFEAHAFRSEKPLYVELDKIYRQKDDQFVTLLNHLRNNTVTEADIALLNQYYRPGFKPAPADDYITLTTHNHKADSINRQMLQELQGPSYVYEAVVNGEFSEFAYPADQKLELKTGAQVMFTKNDSTGAQRYFNGKIGTVLKLNKNRIEVRFNDTGKIIEVDQYEWKNQKFVLDETTNEIKEETAGTFTQYPLKLAWAITVHKSQGLTFEKAVVDIGRAFAPGQVYVALSRLTSLSGLVLLSPVNTSSLAADDHVKEFTQARPTYQDLEKEAETASLDFLENYLLVHFDFSALLGQLRAHMDAGSEQKKEKRSVKQKYKKETVKIFENIEKIKRHADRFAQEITQLITARGENFMHILKTRVETASNYFLPLLWEQSDVFINIMENIKNEKRIKSYLGELIETEASIYTQIKNIEKAVGITAAVAGNREFTRSDITTVTRQEEQRRLKLERALTKTEVVSGPDDEQDEDTTAMDREKTKSRRGKKTNAQKTPKPDTKQESLHLYREGKSIEEIAVIRGLVRGTIEAHLAHFVTKGELSVFAFITEGQFNRIAEELKKTGKFELSALKEKFGNEFTYGELRLAMAGYLAKLVEDPA